MRYASIHRTVVCLGIGVAGVCAAAAAGGITELGTAISQVTVYPGCARVTRQGTLALATGSQQVAIRGLPAWLDPESVRARLEGPPDAALLGAHARNVTRPAHTVEQLRQAEAAVAEARDKIAAAKAELAAVQAEAQYLDKLLPWRSEKLPDQGVARPITAAEFKQVNDYLAQTRLENARRTGDLTRQLRLLEEDAKTQDDALAKMKAAPAVETTDLVLDLKAGGAGKALLQVAYLVAGAQWYPEHALSVVDGQDTVQFQPHGVVQQATGEDWSDVAVTLASTHPLIEQTSPVLKAWEVAPTADAGATAAIPMGARVQAAYSARLTLLQKRWHDLAGRGEDTQAAMRRLEDNRAKVEVAVLQASARGTAVEMAAEGRYSVKGDGEPVVASAAAGTLKLERQYRLSPMASPKAVVVGMLRNTLALPLLPGPVNILRGDQLLGQQPLDMVGVGERFELDLGATDAVTAERSLDKAGSDLVKVGPSTRLTVSHRVAVRSSLKGDAKVEVREQLPVAAGAIKAELVQTAPRAEIAADGVVTWHATVSGASPTELTFAYCLEYPADSPPPAILALERQVRNQ